MEEEGFIVERGVNGFLDNKPGTLELAKDLGLPLYVSNDAARRRFVVKGHGLVELPSSPISFLRSPLLSPLGKLRLLMEPFIARGYGQEDESLADFARRRLGEEALRWLIDPMATGIYAGDPERLSLRGCFPRIHELEQEYGSLIRAMIALQRRARKEGKTGPGAGPGGTLTSFTRGMGEMISALAGHFRACIKTSSPVEEVRPSTNGWEVATSGGETIECSHVVLAAPAHDCAGMLRNTLQEVSRLAREVDYPPVVVVALGVKKGPGVPPMDGFGFLAPAAAGRQILGVLWDSSVFPNRAPEGYHLVRVLLGGARNREVFRLKDEELLNLVRRELKELMGLEQAPDYVSIYRWARAIPQYNCGHLERQARIEAELARHPGLFIRCNWVGGVSFNDCIANSKRLAQEMAR